MKILGIDTTRKIARIFVYNNDEEEKEYHIAIDENIKHSEGVFLYLEKILYDSGLKISDFDYFVGIVGPGSFTGIRVGMSIIKAFNVANDKSVIPLNAFELLANDIKNGTVILNSTTTMCYYGQIKGRQIVETGVIEKSKISEIDDDIYVLKEEQNVLALEYNNVIAIENISKNYIPAVLNKIKKQEIESFDPYYLQLSQAERNKSNE